MGIEYQARFDDVLSSGRQAEIIVRLQKLPTLGTLAHVQNSTISFRFSDRVRDEEWSEDFVIEVNSSSCYVLFHGGTLPMQEQVLEEIVHVFEEYGYQLLFDDL